MAGSSKKCRGALFNRTMVATEANHRHAMAGSRKNSCNALFNNCNMFALSSKMRRNKRNLKAIVNERMEHHFHKESARKMSAVHTEDDCQEGYEDYYEDYHEDDYGNADEDENEEDEEERVRQEVNLLSWEGLVPVSSAVHSRPNRVPNLLLEDCDCVYSKDRSAVEQKEAAVEQPSSEDQLVAELRALRLQGKDRVQIPLKYQVDVRPEDLEVPWEDHGHVWVLAPSKKKCTQNWPKIRVGRTRRRKEENGELL